MERFRAAHFTSSKELKKRKGFRNKVKNLLSAKTSKNELSARGKLETSGLGVQPVDLNRWRFDPRRMKKKPVEIQFITDITSKILESAEAVTPQYDMSHEEVVVPESANESEPEIVAEVKNDVFNQSSNSIRTSANEKNDIEVRVISATLSVQASVVTEINHNESVKPVGDSALKTSGKKLKNSKDKKRKSKVIEFIPSGHISPVVEGICDIPSPCEKSNDMPHRGDTVPLNLSSTIESEREIVADENNFSLNRRRNSLHTSASEKRVEIHYIPASLSLPATDMIETSQNEGVKSKGGSVSETSGKKLKNKIEKKRKSKSMEFSASELTVPNDRETHSLPSHSEKSNENDSFHNLSAASHNAFVSDSAVLINLPVHPEECVSSFEMEPCSTDTCDIEPLIVRSEGENSMKNFIAARLESVCRIGNGDRDYVAKVTQSMKEILCSSEKVCRPESTAVTNTSDDTTCRLNVSQTFVREKLESLSMEESSDCGVSALRDIFHTHSKARCIVPVAGDSDVCGTKKPQIDIRCLENDRFLLKMKCGDSVYVRGKITVSVVVGCAEILGYKLRSGNELEKYTVFSPHGVSLLSFKSCVSSNLFPNDDVLQSICAHKQLPDNLIDSLGESDCVLLLEKAESNVVNYLSLHLPNKLFPNLLSVAKGKRKYSFAEITLECEFLTENSEENVKLFCKGDDWESLSDVILSENCMNDTNCTVVCGGKGVGKSTLLRFLINRSLSSHKKILCLDFDLGQAEFTVPGCISAVIIEKPLLGPNFTHLLQPERMVFIGDLNASNCLTQYLQGAKFIIDYCKSQAEFQNIPWFVNTMGFCKGLGVEIMINLLHMVSPTNVIQLQSRSNKRNFPKHLESEYVRNYKSSLTYIGYINRNLYYDLHLIPSAAEYKYEGQEAEWGLDSRTMREIVVMSYLSGMTAPPNYSLTELVPYLCSFKDLKLCVSHETVNPKSVLSVMNGSFVALCICDKGEMLQPSDPNLPCIMLHAPVCRCLGFGIIRGVDMEGKQLYVISPLPEDEIHKVNCLVMGTVQLPSSVLLREATCGIVGHVPYTVIGPGQPTGRLSQKSSCRLLLSSAVGL